MVRLKVIILILGDILLLYGALAVTLLGRYGPLDFRQSFITHFWPFSFIFFIWLVVFYIADLYQIRNLRSGLGIIRNLTAIIILNIFISITLFYLFAGFFELTPKTNLAIFALIFGILDFGWRLLVIKRGFGQNRTLIIGDSPPLKEIVSYLKDNIQVGYELKSWIKNEVNENSLKEIINIIKEKKIDAVIIPSDFMKKDLPVAKVFYKLLPLNITLINSVNFYEMIFQKEPLEELSEEWFIEKITTRKNFYDFIKRVLDVLMAILLGILVSPIMLFIAVLIKLTSSGPVIFKQKRMGWRGEVFTLYKFRTMRNDNQGPLWTTQDDDRITSLGKILRFSHLDEIPQLYNIAKGDISFIGPRAERIELAELYSQLPRYELRHIIKPGFTGWAQINYKPSASVEEAFEKLKYDIFYIKNRSFVIDAMIIFKTAGLLFKNRS